MKQLLSPWNAVSKETIVNCFKKSNISQSNQQAAVNDDDDPFKSLQEDLEKLHELDNDAIQPNLSAESFADLDSEVVTSASFSNDDDIIAEVIEGENEESEDDQDDEESTPPTRPSTNEVEDALETLQDLSLFSTRGDEIRSLVLNMESLLVRERIDNLKQSVVTDFSKRREKKRKASQSSSFCQTSHTVFHTLKLTIEYKMKFSVTKCD